MPAADTPHALADAAADLFATGGWVGVSPRDAFAAFSAAEAAARPVPGAHTAWELALHLAAWHEAVRRRLTSDPTAEPDADWPAPPTAPADADWAALRARLGTSLAAALDAARAFPAARIGETVPGQTFTFGAMVRGLGEHALYHAAQARLLRRALDAAAQNR